MNMTSFTNIEKWRRHFIDQSGIDEPDKFPFIVFANKCDSTAAAKVSIEQAAAALEQENMVLIEVSAKTGQNIQEGFEALIRKFLEWRKTARRSSLIPRIQPPEGALTQRDRSCCSQ
jgi:GTPase SAR1 family protein